ncbi:hypothetical protein SKAU_G00290660 [Synaphobranchus kaupii]|uniref:Uncharacterized protein n=1 Tax=Synaphobranchus kaupii TaxID=118154 RepID=A0A9Q1ETR9_SYNKA|nr:hypothetical protein SKAU_G00290660 [Synaphobranchus kaupii]
MWSTNKYSVCPKGIRGDQTALRRNSEQITQMELKRRIIVVLDEPVTLINIQERLLRKSQKDEIGGLSGQQESTRAVINHAADTKDALVSCHLIGFPQKPLRRVHRSLGTGGSPEQQGAVIKSRRPAGRARGPRARGEQAEASGPVKLPRWPSRSMGSFRRAPKQTHLRKTRVDPSRGSPHAQCCGNCQNKPEDPRSPRSPSGVGVSTVMNVSHKGLKASIC